MSQTAQQLVELVDKLPEGVQKQIYHYAQSEAVKLGLTVNETVTQSSPKSFLQVAEELGAVGCVENGPPDLSTNPKYMEGFGT